MLRAEFRLGMLPILDVLMREIAEREVYIKAHGHLEPPGRNDHKWLCLAHLCEVAAACANARYHPGEELLQSVCTAALPHASHLSTEARHPQPLKLLCLELCGYEDCVGDTTVSTDYVNVLR